ncbi:hypothetical protein HK405_014553 [Cladochytrium tenue]|nr:hypothetical protein HK405_014553 [Cladochytrium tenue]
MNSHVVNLRSLFSYQDGAVSIHKGIRIEGNAKPGQEGVGFYVAEDLATAQHYGTMLSAVTLPVQIRNNCGLLFPKSKVEVKEYVKALGKKKFSFLKSEYEKVGPIMFSRIVGRAVGGHDTNQLVLRQHHIKSLHGTAACVPNSQYRPQGDTHFSFSATWNDQECLISFFVTAVNGSYYVACLLGLVAHRPWSRPRERPPVAALKLNWRRLRRRWRRGAIAWRQGRLHKECGGVLCEDDYVVARVPARGALDGTGVARRLEPLVVV